MNAPAPQLLQLDVAQFNTSEGLVDHIRASMLRGLPELVPAFLSHDGTIVLCGSGPTLANFAEEIRAEKAKGRPIVAIKGAHDWLVDQGIEPDLYVTLDPRDRRNTVQRATENTVYMIASRCPPSMFDHLKDRRVIIWHSYSSEEELRYFKGSGRELIGGGSTSGLRAMNIGYLLGFRKFVLYGFDSCNTGTQKRIDGSQTGKTIDIFVGGPNGPKFTCNLSMAQQAKDFQMAYTYLPDITVESHGDGLITAILAERRARGVRA